MGTFNPLSTKDGIKYQIRVKFIHSHVQKIKQSQKPITKNGIITYTDPETGIVIIPLRCFNNFKLKNSISSVEDVIKKLEILLGTKDFIVD